MKFKDGVVFFKTNEPWYEKQKSGIRNNMVCILSESEYNVVSWCLVVQIEISNSTSNQYFRRDLTDISGIGCMCGMHIVVFTWKLEEENGQ